MKGKYYTEEQKTIYKFILIIVVIAVLSLIIYLVTDKFVKNESNNIIDIPVNYNIASIGTMFNRPYDNYYVLIYDSNDTKSTYYDLIVSKYQNEENSKKVYFVDLNDNINKKYYDVNNDGVSNSKATTIEELDLGDLTLIEIKDKKIVKYLENVDLIEKEFTENSD